VSVEPAIFGGAGQCVKTVHSVEGGPGTFAFADAAGDGGDGDERVLRSWPGDRTNQKTPTVANRFLASRKKRIGSVDMTIPTDAIDDTIDFSDLEAK